MRRTGRPRKKPKGREVPMYVVPRLPLKPYIKNIPLYNRIASLKKGMALEINFSSESYARNVIAALRSHAYHDGQRLGVGHVHPSLTYYFWLEIA
jgi:hypothetical protein